MERFLTSGIQRAMLYERKLGQPLATSKRKRKTAVEKKAEDDGLYLFSVWSWQVFYGV